MVLCLGLAACTFTPGGPAAVADGSGDHPAHPDAAPPPTSYAATVLADGPVSYWPLDDDAGTTVRDLLGASPGTVNGSGCAFRQTGGFGGAFGIHFDEQDCELDVSTTLFQFPGNAPYTIEAWAVIDPNADKTFRHVFTHEDRKNNGPEQGYALAYIDTTHVRAERGVTMNSFVDADSGTLAAGFHYLAVTYDGATLTLYVDGQQAAASPTTDMMPSFTDMPAMIGAAPTTGQHFFGVIDDVAIYDRALGASQIAAHRQAGN